MNFDLMLRLSNITKTYRKQHQEITALRDMSMSVSRGETVGIVGPNGSGKSTLIKIIAGLCLPESGQIDWASQHRRRRNLGMLLEGRLNLMERLSPLENARYYCALRACDFSADLFQRLARDLDLTDLHTPIRKLSTGNKLRSSLLLALIHRPSLVLLDEPTTGMDSAGVSGLTQLVRNMSERGCGFLICSHDLEFVDSVCQHIICLSQGITVFNGCKADFQRIQFHYRVNLPAEGKLNTYFIKNHRDLCDFLCQHKQDIDSSALLEVKRLSLRDNYEELISGRLHESAQ